MNTFARRLSLAALAALAHFLLVGPASAQAPKISYISPIAGKAGSTFELTVTGQDLGDTETLYFSFPGAKIALKGSETAKVFEPNPKLKKMAAPPKNQLTQRFVVTLPANAPLGIQDVRIVGKHGVSNPRAFIVSDVTEATEQEPNDDVPKAQKIELNSGVTGVIAAGTDVDYFVFSGKKGQRVVVSCLTTSVDSKLPVLLQLYGPSSENLAANKSYQNNDALVDAVLPADGDYYIRVCSFTYLLGGADYFYHLSVSTAPWIDAVFPPAVEPGKETKVTVYGRNLPGGVVDPQSLYDGKMLEKLVTTVKAPAAPESFPGYLAPLSAGVEGFGFRLKNDAGSSNTVLIALARAPVVLETSDNDTPAKAQKVTVPCEIAGMIEKKGDQDWYVFHAAKGQVFAITALGDRLGSQIDLYFRLYNDKDVLITEQDENPDITANQFYTRTDDPARYKFVVPADGEYKLMVTSRFAFVQFGPRTAYTVCITPDSADFAVVAMPNSVLSPDSINLNQASNQAYTVFVLRQGTLASDITLSGDKLPPGITVQPQVIAANQKQGNLIVSAAPDAPPFVGGIRVLATAMIDGKKVVHTVAGATITWPVPQAAPTISRLDRELVLAVRDKAPFTVSCDKSKISVLQGEKITFEVKATRSPDFKQPINVVAVNLPGAMVQTTPLTLTPGKDAGTITLDGKGAAVPVGNFTLAVRGQTQPVLVKQQPKGPEPLNLVQVCNPISLTIVPKSVAKLTVLPAALKVPVGKGAEIVVKVARTNDYMGPFEVTIADAKGFNAKKGVIAAGQDEVKLIVTTDANPGANVTATIRATAMFNATPVVHETKVTLTAAK